MTDLHSDDPHVGIDKSAHTMRALLSEWRGKSFTVVWAAAVLVATAGWLYFMARGAWSIVNWLFS
jgi:hypothetical protein